MALSWMMASAMASVQRIPERSIRSLIRFLQAFDRTTGNGPALGQVLVIAHPSAIAVKVARYARKHFVLGSEKSALGGALATALDNLAHLAAEDAQGVLPNPHLCLRASFGMKHVRCFPEFLQNMKQIEDQGDIQCLVDPDL